MCSVSSHKCVRYLHMNHLIHVDNSLIGPFIDWLIRGSSKGKIDALFSEFFVRSRIVVNSAHGCIACTLTENR